MTMRQARLAEVAQRDARYAYEAYEFLFAALSHAQKMHGKVPPDSPPGREAEQQYHVSGRELLEGVRDLALREYGLMARTVFRMWGINSTADFGEIVFRLVEESLMSKTAEDSLDDFRDVYDLDEALVRGYRIDLDDAE
jgi:uncharacterized repeat protein (TIGR04138 family)